MSNNFEKYSRCFTTTFELPSDYGCEELSYQSIPQWDSVGHLELITNLETEFQIRLEVDDVIDFSSFEVGRQILSRLGVQF